MISKIRLLLFLLLISTALISLPSKTNAATSVSPNGITVSPAFQMVSIPTGVTQVPANFTITNDKPTSQTLSLSVADFNTLNESGGLFFVGTNPTQLQKRYGLAKWVSLPEKSVTLAPKQTVQLQLQILNLSSLQAGGHYGALMLAIDNGSNPSNNIGLHPIASSLLFVTKTQGAVYSLDLSGVNIKHNLFSLPKSVVLNFSNQGNTHVVPRGFINVQQGKSSLLEHGVINDGSSIVLPQANRLLHTPLTKITNIRFAGRYTINIYYRFDGYNNFRVYQASYTYVAPWLLAVVVLVLVFVVLALVSLVLKKHRTKKHD